MTETTSIPAFYVALCIFVIGNRKDSKFAVQVEIGTQVSYINSSNS